MEYSYPRGSKSARLSQFNKKVPIVGLDETIEFISPVVGMKRQSDTISSRNNKRFQVSKGGQQIVQPNLRVSLDRGIKGLGYVKPGSYLDRRPKVLKHDFAFDMVADRSVRDWTRLLFRHSHSNYENEGDHILSPAIGSTTRMYDGVAIKTPVRKGGSASAQVFYSAISLPDLEVASWNANPLKLFYDNAANFSATTGGVANVVTFKDYIPNVPHPRTTPFPSAATSASYSRGQDPFMCHLGPGSVVFNIQNKLPTNCQIEIVVAQLAKDRYAILETNYHKQAEALAQLTYTRSKQGSYISTGTLEGEPVDSSCLDEPSAPFLRFNKKFADEKPCITERFRTKFELTGGASKKVSLALPSRIYNPKSNYFLGEDPFAQDPLHHSRVNNESYMMWITLNGVVMPVFCAQISTDDTRDTINETVIDRQTCPASILVTGTYTEHPSACLSTPDIADYQVDGELQDAYVADGTTGTALVNGYTVPVAPFYDDLITLASGIIAQEPISVSTGQVRAVSVPNESTPKDYSYIS